MKEGDAVLKRLLGYMFCVGLLFVVALAHTPPVTTFGEMKAQVRTETGFHSTTYLPDTTLVDFCQRALVYTSTDIGGIEMQWKFNTAARTAFYAIPDTIVEILHATLISEQRTYTLKAWHPELFSDMWDRLDGEEFPPFGEESDETPVAYNYWADSIQLIPIPQKVDSIYLKCYVEYPSHDTAAGDSLHLIGSYSEAAIAYAIHLTYKRARLFDEATLYLNRYKELKAELRSRYRRKLNAASTGQ